MNVRIDDVLQPEATLAQQVLVGLSLNRRVDDRGVVRAARDNEAGRAATAFIQELLEVHDDRSGTQTRCAGLSPLPPPGTTGKDGKAGPSPPGAFWPNGSGGEARIAGRGTKSIGRPRL